MRYFLFSVLSLALIVSSLFHAIQVDHNHRSAGHAHENTDSGVRIEAMHAVEKKLYLFTLFSPYVPSVLLTSATLASLYQLFTRTRHRYLFFLHTLFDTWRALLRCGVMHPKLF